MKQQAQQLDSMLADLEKLVAKRSGTDLDMLDTIDINGANKDELLLKMLKIKRKVLQVQDSCISGSLGITRFMGDWNFDEDLVDMAYEIEKFYNKLYST